DTGKDQALCLAVEHRLESDSFAAVGIGADAIRPIRQRDQGFCSIQPKLPAASEHKIVSSPGIVIRVVAHEAGEPGIEACLGRAALGPIRTEASLSPPRRNRPTRRALEAQRQTLESRQ